FRGNVYTKRVLDDEGAVQVVDTTIEYDTLPNGRLHPKALPGEVVTTNISEEDFFLRRNFNEANNADYRDGDSERTLYNAPTDEFSYDENGNFVPNYDNSRGKTSLITNHSIVIKGG